MRETIVGVSLRLLVLLVGLMLLLLGGSVFLHVLGVVPPIFAEGPGIAFMLDLTGVRVPIALLWGAGGLLAALVGILLLILSFVRATARQHTVVLTTQSSNGLYGGGEVTVTVESLKSVAAFAGERVDGIREIDPRLVLKKDGWHVLCHASVVPQASLPQTIGELKTTLTEALEHHTGIPVARVDVHTQLSAIDADRRVR